MKTILNLGSGKTRIPDALNVDINPMWEPDVVLDIQRPMYMSDAGNWCGALPNNYFEKIIVHDVLEHLPNLVHSMTNCLMILKEGGIMDIKVPYDLSHGAWQDPTHVRAFNERSWVYYWEWAFYLGWKEYGLKMIELTYSVADWVTPGYSPKELIRTPRAIEFMHVILKKEKLPDEFIPKK